MFQISNKSEMSLGDTAYIIGVQAVAGLGFGTTIDFLFNKFDPAIAGGAYGADYTFPIHCAEFFGQVFVDAWVADMFIRSMNSRGENFGGSLIGLAPFWVWYLGSQSHLAKLANSIVLYVRNLFNTATIPVLKGGALGGAAASNPSKRIGPSATGARVSPFATEDNSINYSQQTRANDYNFQSYAE